jgi:CDGSH-type Zn-finger protein
MARLVRHEDDGPHEVKPAAESRWICMCGLSRNRPYCDGSHLAIPEKEKPGKLYRWEGDEAREIPEG